MMLDSGALREAETIGRYRVLRTLDDSGRHAVVLAEAPNSRLRIAVRFAREAVAHPPLLEAFLREQEVAESLDRLGVPRVIEVGEDPAIGPFLATEFVDGLSLRESLRRGALELDTAFAVLVDAANVLEAAHEAGVVHGDLRPSRILVDRTGAAVVTGFGAGNDEPPVAVGAQWPYLAPERIAGAPPSREADRWAFAAIAFELFTGKPPGEDDRLTALSDPGLRGVFLRALGREPSRRHGSLRLFLEDLLSAGVVGETERAALLANLPPARGLTPEETSRRQHRVVAFAVFGIIGALFLRAGGDWLLGQVPVPPTLRVLEVSSAPEGATVLVDGVPVGETPRRIVVAGDASRLRVDKEGYQPVDRILGGSERAIELALERAAPVRVAAVARRPRTGTDRAALAPRSAGTEARPASPPEATGLLPLLADWLRE